jgi:endonuclease YncB( thermonuclease family)
MRKPLATVLALFCILAGPATAQAAAPVKSATVVEVIDGDTVVLDPPVDDAREVRLVGIQAPKLPLDRPGFVAWPLAEEAKQALVSLLAKRMVRLSFGGRERDRYGRLLAHLHRDDGLWAQGEMLRLGFARVYTFADNTARYDAMIALERDARAAGAGIWGHPFYAIRTAESVVSDIGSFQLVEGRVLAAARVDQRIYLNFGPDWRADFTIIIASGSLRSFTKAGLDPLTLNGQNVRVRGWVESVNGPAIEVTHPQQIEVVPAQGPQG